MQPKKQGKPDSSFLQPRLRMHYFTCSRGKDHQGQLLNYVCVKKDCDKHGLLCSMCKADHPNHTTVALKILLSKLQKHKEKPLDSSEGFQDELSQLEQIHKTMLLELRTCVENLSEKFREVEMLINEQFSKAKIQFLERVQINMKFNSFIEDAIANKCQNRQQFADDIAKIASMIEVIDNGKQFNFSANLDYVVKTYQIVKKDVCDNLNKMQKFVLEQNFVRYEDAKNSDTKPKKQKQKQKQTVQQKIQTNFFSQTYKSGSILLQQRVARQTKTGDGRFVFTNIQLQSPNQKVTFKIKTLKNWIGLGIGIRQKLKLVNFRFEYNNLGHGSYLISSNGYSWSHTEASNNITVVGFKFKENQIIQLQYLKDKIIYTNKSTLQKHELKIGFNEAEQKDIFFCANLCSEGDCVELVDNS